MKNKLLFFEPPIKLKEEQLVRDSLNFRGKKKKKKPVWFSSPFTRQSVMLSLSSVPRARKGSVSHPGYGKSSPATWIVWPNKLNCTCLKPSASPSKRITVKILKCWNKAMHYSADKNFTFSKIVPILLLDPCRGRMPDHGALSDYETQDVHYEIHVIWYTQSEVGHVRQHSIFKWKLYILPSVCCRNLWWNPTLWL